MIAVFPSFDLTTDPPVSVKLLSELLSVLANVMSVKTSAVTLIPSENVRFSIPESISRVKLSNTGRCLSGMKTLT